VPPFFIRDNVLMHKKVCLGVQNMSTCKMFEFILSSVDSKRCCYLINGRVYGGSDTSMSNPSINSIATISTNLLVFIKYTNFTTKQWTMTA
jgi:hypothetical protein